MPDHGALEIYGVAIKMPFKGASEENSTFKVYMGPLDHSLLKSYNNGLEGIMSLGCAAVITSTGTPPSRPGSAGPRMPF